MAFDKATRDSAERLMAGADLHELREAAQDLRALAPDNALAQLVEEKIELPGSWATSAPEELMRTSSSPLVLRAPALPSQVTCSAGGSRKAGMTGTNGLIAAEREHEGSDPHAQREANGGLGDINERKHRTSPCQ